MNISKLFLESIPPRCQQIFKYVVTGPETDSTHNRKQLVRLFHALKTSAKMAGFNDLSSLAQVAETASENERNFCNINKFAQYLQSAVSTPEILAQSNPKYQEILAGFKSNQPQNTTKGDRNDSQ